MIEESKRSDMNEEQINSMEQEEEDNNIIPQETLQPLQINRLRQEALSFQKHWNELKVTFGKDDTEVYYLLSKRWLTRWKKYVSYEEITEDKEPSEYFGGPKPHKVNEDLIDNSIELCFRYSPLKEHPWNIQTKEKLQEGVDYEIVNKRISDNFINLYEGKQIPRQIVGEGKEKYVEVNLLRFQTVLLYPGVIGNYAYGWGKQKLDREYLQVSRQSKVSDYYALIEKTLPTFRGTFQKERGVRIWRLTGEDLLKELWSTIKKQTQDLDHSEDIVFDLEGELLDQNCDKTIEEYGITQNDLIIVEFKETNKPWSIRNPQVPNEGKCEGCYSIKVLNYPCVCKKVAYCSERCKVNDERYHSSKCEKQASDDETVKEMVHVNNSIDGVCGLSNLGNTCFMNSGLQCLSNTQPLAEYFLSNKYFEEINEDNPLGTKGVLVRKYASLMKKLWYGTKTVVTPTALKMAVGKFQPMFKGYHQHDSSELITFLLDGIHEDLNRIKKKPYVESNDDQNRSDFSIAKEAWENHQKRNQSIVVDLMHGQYKSKLECPKCSRISITFDPYLMVGLSIPNTKKKFLTYTFYSDFLRQQKKTVPFDKNANQTVQDFMNSFPEEVIVFYTATYQSYDIIKPERNLNDVRKKSKRTGLGVRVLDPLEKEVPQEQRVFVPISNKCVEGHTYKKSIYHNSLIVLSKDFTLKQAHYRCFQLISFLFKHKNVELDEEYYETQVKDKYYYLELKSNGSFWQGCAFCGKKNCNDCRFPYTDDNFGEYLDKAQSSDSHVKLELIIVWNETPFEKTRISDIYDYYAKNYIMKVESSDEKEESYSNSTTMQPCVTLLDCIQESQRSEQLEADNTWYCRNCKDHVQAYKSMQIYKAPKILIFHLKRFKACNRMFKQKLETLVDFPINGFDMTDYLLNKNVPGEYETESEERNGENAFDGRILYDLYAVSNHYGGLGGGHYTAFAKNAINGHWYNFDDSHVSQLSNSESVVSKGAYVLFYKRREIQENSNFNHLEN